MKVVINNCFGGFSLSHEGMLRYAAIKGMSLFPEIGKFGFTTYWTVPPEADREDQSDFHALEIEERKASNERIRSQQLYERDFERNDPVLVQVVEELGSAANGRCAELKVVEVPDDVEWEISEYDGNEQIAEVHRTWS